MADERLPIKFFAPREIDDLKVEGSGSSDMPTWVLEGTELEQRSLELSRVFEQFSNAIIERTERNSAVPFIFVAKMCDDATAKSRRRDISALFRNGSYSNVIGLADSDELIVKIDSTAHMHDISRRLKDYNRNSYALSCLETFWEFQPFIETDSDESSLYKIKLIDFLDYETNISMQRLFERALTSCGIFYKKSNYTNQFPVYRVEMSPQAVLDGLSGDDAYEMLFSIEPMPRYTASLDSLTEESDIEVIRPTVGRRYETLGILDSGIETIPHLAPWMTEKRWTVYPESSITPTHGTFVAGIALYGDVCEGKEWVGHEGINIFDATVFPNEKEGLEEDELIENIREAVRANYENIKIWNLSISVERPVCDNKFSDLAIALDELQTKYNILICKSAGNCRNFISGRTKGRINEGADSIRSLVVGSVAHAKNSNDFAEIDNPSPFSRVGPGPEYIIKPEVSHYGGNAGVDKNGKLVTTGVKSFSKDGVLLSSVGTSFSTPRIAALATGLYQELDEDFDPLLLKALIVHSSTYSDNLQIPISERTNQLGFGVPKSVSQILYNAPYEATLILRDTLSKGEKIDIMDFPMPNALIRDGYYTGQIIATLVYDPILDSSQGIEYCQSNIDIKFGSYDGKKERDTTKRNILNPVGRDGAKNLLLEGLYSKRLMRDNHSDFALRERLLIQYADKYYPVKKYAVDLSELSEANKQNYATADKQWYLYLNGLFREHIEQRSILKRETLSQDFCFIITIRDPERRVNVYDEITHGLDAYNFWHKNIKISTDISVSNKSTE
jgi:hypothetical protein